MIEGGLGTEEEEEQEEEQEEEEGLIYRFKGKDVSTGFRLQIKSLLLLFLLFLLQIK